MRNIFIAALFFASQVFAADTVIQSDKVKLGRKSSSANKTVEFDINAGAANPKITVNPSTSKLQFTNDGVAFKDIGSGSGSGGSGKNILVNGDFETGITEGWTSSGGSFAATTSAQNEKQAQFQATATSQYFQSILYAIPEEIAGKSCMAKIGYSGTGAGLKIRVLDSANVSVIGTAEPALEVTSSNYFNDAKVYFTCPSAGTQIRLRVESTAATAIVKFDNAHLGSADFVNSKQAQFVGSVNFSACPSNPFSTTSTVVVDVTFGACYTTITGNVTPASGNVFGVTVQNAKAGTYFVKINIATRANGGATTYAGISDGTSVMGSFTTGFSGVGDVYGVANDATFTYSSDVGPKTFKLQILRGGSNGTSYAEYGGGANISVFFFPSGNDVVVNSRCDNPIKCADRFVASINSGTGAYSAENIPGWLTAYSKPTTGTYTLTFASDVLSGGSLFCDAQVINIPSGGNAAVTSNVTYSGNTITVYVKQTVSFVDSNFSLKCDKTGANYQLKKEMTGFFSGFAKSPSNLRIEKVRVVGSGGEGTNCTASPCTMLRASSGISSVTRSSTGDYVINFVGGTFSEPPSCSYAVSNGASPVVPVELQLPTSADVGIAMRTTGGSGTDTKFDVTCVGRGQ